MRTWLLSKYKIISDPVYGYIKVYDYEIPILETRVFQRLKRIKHLGITDFVYPGATHTVFLHSVGVAYVVENMVKEILKKINVRHDDIERYTVILRLIALLHDIGYGPYTYLFNNVILFPRRLTHRDIGARIVEEFDEILINIEKILNEYGYSCKHIAQAIKSDEINVWPFKSSINNEVNETILFYFVKGMFSANTIDRILRDSYYTGVARKDSVDWHKLIYYITTQGNNIIFDSKAIDVLEQILSTRLKLLKYVYYDAEVRSISKFCENLLKILDQKVSNFDIILKAISRYLELDDYTIFYTENAEKIKEIKLFLSGINPYKVLTQCRTRLDTLVTIDLEKIENSIAEIIKNNEINIEIGSEFFIDTIIPLIRFIIKNEDILIRYEDGTMVKTNVYDLINRSAIFLVPIFRIYVRKDLFDKMYALKHKILSLLHSQIGCLN